MTEKEIICALKNVLVNEYGFVRMGKHFYKDICNDLTIVFGLQKSRYGEYAYLERGYCIKSINQYLPYPKFYQLNLNCGRIMTKNGQAIHFAEVDEHYMEDLIKIIIREYQEMSKRAELEKEQFIAYYLEEAKDLSWYILGDATAAYFGLTRKAFQFHFVND